MIMKLFNTNIFNKNSYKYIIMVLTVLVLGMLLLGNYNLVEGATNADANTISATPATLASTTDLAAPDATKTLYNTGNLNSGIVSRNNIQTKT